ncbi:TIGR00730 family Rossman fold protein [Leuconostoc fallax]|uniref:LOG family protein n=1 Tax=Leuconostoc fallax TaxID=1251 RepID=UPI0020914E74|nr:TIGR00730 family Rossman fold protein [Leuconostoc fallax]MCO6183481.1 TIGR00730 family Rossman fold protein [Leuconostoc fallax]
MIKFNRIKSVAVFMGSSFGDDTIYEQQTIEMSRLVAQHQLRMVYGGGKEGLMGVAAHSVMAAGGEVIGISPITLSAEAIDPAEITQFIEVDSIDERKQMMIAAADAFIVLPGGFGTLEELAQVISWAKIDLHSKPLALLNTKGFYDSLWRWLIDCVNCGFVQQSELEYLHIFDHPLDIFTYFKSFDDV